MLRNFHVTKLLRQCSCYEEMNDYWSSGNNQWLQIVIFQNILIHLHFCTRSQPLNMQSEHPKSFYSHSFRANASQAKPRTTDCKYEIACILFVCRWFQSRYLKVICCWKCLKFKLSIHRNIAGGGSHGILCFCVPTVQRTSVGCVAQRGPRTSRSTTPASALAASSLSTRNGVFSDQVFKTDRLNWFHYFPHLHLISFVSFWILSLKCILKNVSVYSNLHCEKLWKS